MIKIGLISFPAGNLSRSFDRPLRTGDREMVAAALRSGLATCDGAAWAERDVIVGLAGAMIRYVDRRSRLVLLYGGVGRHLRLVSLADFLTDWAFALYKAPINHRENTERVKALSLHLNAMSVRIPELTLLRAAVSALDDTCVREQDEPSLKAA